MNGGKEFQIDKFIVNKMIHGGGYYNIPSYLCLLCLVLVFLLFLWLHLLYFAPQLNTESLKNI